MRRRRKRAMRLREMGRRECLVAATAAAKVETAAAKVEIAAASAVKKAVLVTVEFDLLVFVASLDVSSVF